MTNRDVLVFSIALEGYSNLFSGCIRSHHNYCSNHNFHYVLVDKAPRPLKSTEAAWLKIFLLRSALNCQYKWIAFIDADCEIRDHAPSFVEDLRQFRNDKSIFMATGFSGRINSGIVFLKNTADAIDYLEKVIRNGDNEVPDEDKALYENGHMIHFGKNNPHIQLIDSIKWNNNSHLDKGSYIQHFSGGKLRKHYLGNQDSSKKKKNPFSAGIQKIRRRFPPKKVEAKMQEIGSLLPFYLENYPVFHCDQ